MKRDLRLKSLFWIRFGFLSCGLIFAITFQFTGIWILAMIGLASFALAFLLMTVSEIDKLIFLQSKTVEQHFDVEDNIVLEHDNNNEVDASLNQLSSKLEQNKKEVYFKKLVLGIKILFSLSFAIFTVVVMFLF